MPVEHRRAPRISTMTASGYDTGKTGRDARREIEIRGQREILVIMGLSGGGKSTLLSILMGLLKPNAGSVLFKNEYLTKLSRPKLNEGRTHVGIVYQNAALEHFRFT